MWSYVSFVVSAKSYGNVLKHQHISHINTRKLFHNEKEELQEGQLIYFTIKSKEYTKDNTVGYTNPPVMVPCIHDWLTTVSTLEILFQDFPGNSEVNIS